MELTTSENLVCTTAHQSNRVVGVLPKTGQNRKMDATLAKPEAEAMSVLVRSDALPLKEEKLEALLLLTMKLETDAHLLRQEIRTACSQSSTSLHMLPLIDQCCISLFVMMFAAIVYIAISAPEALKSTKITGDSSSKKHGAKTSPHPKHPKN